MSSSVRHPVPVVGATVAVWLSVAAASAQCVQLSKAPFMGAPIAVSLDDASPGAPVALQCGGFTTARPATFPGGRPISFDLDDMMRSFPSSPCAPALPSSVPMGMPLPDIDAMSLGEDWIVADDMTGRIPSPLGMRWAGVTWSVARGSVGAAGSPVELEATANDAEADVFFWILPGSNLPSDMVGVPGRTFDREEIGLGGATVPELDALDHYVPLYAMDPDFIDPVLGLVEPNPSVFFSVSSATVGRVPAAWWCGSAPSGATVFRTVWNGAQWSCPRPWRRFAQLDLGVNEDLDALAIDLRTCRMLFSTKTAARNEILFRNFKTDFTGNMVYKDSDGDPVADEIGLLGGDDVDAICALDPSQRTFSQRPGLGFNPTHVTYGTPIAPGLIPGLPRTIEATSFLSCWGGGPAELVSYANGEPPGGASSGFLAAFLTIPINPAAGRIPLGASSFSLLGTVFCSDPQSIRVAIPPGVRFQPVGVEIDVGWIAVDSTFSVYEQSYRVRIEL